MIDGNSFGDGVNFYFGVGKQWYEMPWLQATAQAGAQTYIEVKDSRYQTMEKLLKKYEKNPDQRIDFIKNNGSQLSWSMKFEFWQSSTLINILKPDIYSLKNPIYTPPGILPTPNFRFQPDFRYRYYKNN